MDSGWQGPDNPYDYSSGVPTRRELPATQPEADEPDAPESPGQGHSLQGGLAVRLAVPGAFLIFAGIFNLLGGLLLLLGGLALADEDPDTLLTRIRQDNPEQARMIDQQLDQGNITWEKLMNIYEGGFLVAGGLGFLAGILGIFGGRSMLAGRSYNLALAGALATAIPCVTPMGCLMLGPIFGFWALIILMREESWQVFGR